MSSRARVGKLEQEVRRKMPDKPWLSVRQSLDDASLYHDLEGKAYTAEDLQRLEATHNVLCVVHDADWRGEDAGKDAGPGLSGPVIKMTWGDGDEEEGHSKSSGPLLH